MPYAKFYLFLFVVCVVALVITVWFVPLGLVANVIIKVTLAYLAILFGRWLLGGRNL